MLCKKYQDLSTVEKLDFVGKIIHACQSDDYFFNLGSHIIYYATMQRLYDNVVINPEPIEEMPIINKEN